MIRESFLPGTWMIANTTCLVSILVVAALINAIPAASPAAVTSTTTEVEMAKYSKTTRVKIDCDRSQGVLVHTEFGDVEGFVYTAADGSKANVFLGVPFASPPVGELRFEKPIPPKNWTGVLETKEFKDSCTPYTKSWIQNPTHSEDCLYINIMAPTTPPPAGSGGYPVLMYIHGGGYCFGDVIKTGFDRVTRQFVQNGVVVVTVPYRVGLYGFFSTGTKEAEGNNGLWDQLMALTFVHNNIDQFGGNPGNVTLWGQSAGAGSVDALSLSPHSRDLFHKVYQSSGSLFSYWSTAVPMINSSFRLAKALGCESTEPAEVKKFLKTVKAEDILEVTSSFQTDVMASEGRDRFINFGPRLDADFFAGKTLEELLDESPPKPSLMGVMNQEAGLFLIFEEDKIRDFNVKKAEKELDQVFVSKQLAKNESELIRQDVVDFYFDGRELTANECLNAYTDIVSDVMFNQQLLTESDLKSARGWPVFFFIWDYAHPKWSAQFPIKGAFHCYELPFVFDQKPSLDTSGPENDQIGRQFVAMIVNFVHSGDPSSKELAFPRYDAEHRKVLRFDLESRVVEDPWRDRRLFWRGLNERYAFNVLRQRTAQEIRNRVSL